MLSLYRCIIINLHCVYAYIKSLRRNERWLLVQSWINKDWYLRTILMVWWYILNILSLARNQLKCKIQSFQMDFLFVYIYLLSCQILSLLLQDDALGFLCMMMIWEGSCTFIANFLLLNIVFSDETCCESIPNLSF